MMLRIAVSKILFGLHPGLLLNHEIDIVNKFIENYQNVNTFLSKEVEE